MMMSIARFVSFAAVVVDVAAGIDSCRKSLVTAMFDSTV